MKGPLTLSQLYFDSNCTPVLSAEFLKCQNAAVAIFQLLHKCALKCKQTQEYMAQTSRLTKVFYNNGAARTMCFCMLVISSITCTYRREIHVFTQNYSTELNINMFNSSFQARWYNTYLYLLNTFHLDHRETHVCLR